MEALSQGDEPNERPTIFLRPKREEDGTHPWSGWAVLQGGTARPAPVRHPLEAILAGHFGKVRTMIPPRELSIRCGEDLLQSQRQILEQSFPDVHIGGRQIRPGIWISRSVSIHASARLETPLYIGANTRIGPEAHLGPSVAVGSNSIVGARSTALNAMIFPDTYVGDGLELDHVIVNQHHLVDLKVGTSLSAPEAFLFSSLTDHGLTLKLRSLIDRVFAFALLALLGPAALAVVAILCVFKKFSLVQEEFVPSLKRKTGWSGGHRSRSRIEWDGSRPRTGAGRLLFEFTPGLYTVLQGHLSLVGMKARHAAVIEQLPDDWRALYAKSKAGLITEADVFFGPHHSEDELYSSEAYYAVTQSLRHDLYLLGLYLTSFGSDYSHSRSEGLDTRAGSVEVSNTLTDQFRFEAGVEGPAALTDQVGPR